MPPSTTVLAVQCHRNQTHKISLGLSVLLIALLAFLWTSPSANAETPLTTADAEAFVETLQPVNAFGEKLEAEGKTNELGGRGMPEVGQLFTPYSDGVADLKAQYPADYKELGTIIKPAGFTSQETWAVVGDKVISAYMALEMEKEGMSPEDMAMLTPEMLSMVPPAMREQMSRALAMKETLERTPEADKAIVRPLVPALEKELAAME